MLGSTIVAPSAENANARTGAPRIDGERERREPDRRQPGAPVERREDAERVRRGEADRPADRGGRRALEALEPLAEVRRGTTRASRPAGETELHASRDARRAAAERGAQRGAEAEAPAGSISHDGMARNCRNITRPKKTSGPYQPSRRHGTCCTPGGGQLHAERAAHSVAEREDSRDDAEDQQRPGEGLGTLGVTCWHDVNDVLARSERVNGRRPGRGAG